MKEQLSFGVRGVCLVCGCDDENACPGGCVWANASATLCSRCALSSNPIIPTSIDDQDDEIADMFEAEP